MMLDDNEGDLQKRFFQLRIRIEILSFYLGMIKLNISKLVGERQNVETENRGYDPFWHRRCNVPSPATIRRVPMSRIASLKFWNKIKINDCMLISGSKLTDVRDDTADRNNHEEDTANDWQDGPVQRLLQRNVRLEA